MKYGLSLLRRLGIALLDAASSFAEKETLAFGAFLTAVATAGALKAAEAAGITLSASQLAFVAATAGSVAVVVIRQFVGSLAFVKKSLEAQDAADQG